MFHGGMIATEPQRTLSMLKWVAEALKENKKM